MTKLNTTILCTILCITALIIAWMYRPAPTPKPTYRESYVECVEKGGTSCVEVFNFWMEVERTKQEKRTFLDVSFKQEIERCLNWNKKHKTKYDGKNSCARAAQIHMRDLDR